MELRQDRARRRAKIVSKYVSNLFNVPYIAWKLFVLDENEEKDIGEWQLESKCLYYTNHWANNQRKNKPKGNVTKQY